MKRESKPTTSLLSKNHKRVKLTKNDPAPEWFDLAKYDQVKRFSITEWYEQISYRTPDVIKFVGPVEMLRLIEYGPKIDPAGSARLRQYCLNRSLRDDLGSLSVHPVTCEELYGTEQTLSPAQRREARAYIDKLSREDSDSTTSDITPGEWFFNSALEVAGRFTGHLAVVTVDLSHPNKVLSNQFGVLLEQLRGRARVVPLNIGEPELQKLVEKNILPYLDLKIWVESLELKCSDNYLSQQIFPGQQGGVDRFRKTIERWAGIWTSPKGIAALRALAAEEILTDVRWTYEDSVATKKTEKIKKSNKTKKA